MHKIEVIAVSAEEVEHGVAELWANGEQIAWTHYEQGELCVRIEPRKDGSPIELEARSLANALAEVDQLLAQRAGGGPPRQS